LQENRNQCDPSHGLLFMDWFAITLTVIVIFDV
jgi:hypothetical protein